MSNGEASVVVDGFTANGALTFRVGVKNCLNSSGSFRFDYQVRKPTGIEMITDRTANWTNINETNFVFDDDLNLPEDYELLDAEIDDSSIRCTCLD